MIDRTGPSGSGLFMLLLGFMTFGVWHERDSGNAGGGGEIGDFFKGESSHTCTSHTPVVLINRWYIGPLIY